MPKVQAYQISDSLDIKGVKNDLKAELLYSDASELFYALGRRCFLAVYKHGVVSFYGDDPLEITAMLKFLKAYCRNYFPEALSDEFLIETGAKENKIRYNKVEVVEESLDICRMIMLNVSQSVTLDYYSEQTDALLAETNHHTQILEKSGKFAISDANLRKYIGKTLLLKNRIAENLYIFDSPPETWEDEQLDRLHSELKKNFDLQERFRSVSEGLAIVKENLELFKDFLQYRKSNLLEWIVIMLIAVEVVNFLIEKMF
jgi:uncharacterized Rmd1/YagE family protein